VRFFNPGPSSQPAVFSLNLLLLIRNC
jgi:hypothetical protein